MVPAIILAGTALGLLTGSIPGGILSALALRLVYELGHQKIDYRAGKPS